MDKEELENAIREYLTQHASLSLACDPEGDGYMKVSVGLYLDGEEIAGASDTILLS
jgi:hypothetical protein